VEMFYFFYNKPNYFFKTRKVLNLYNRKIKNQMIISRLLKIFSSEQIRKIDAYTIKNEPITSIDLMERAAGAIFDWIRQHFDTKIPVVVLAGTGNNGGDGLATARLLAGIGFRVMVFQVLFSDKISGNCRINLERLSLQGKADIREVRQASDFPEPEKNSLVVDALFGSGLKRPLEGEFVELVKKVNHSGAAVISIDIPSGLFGEDNTGNNPGHIVRADYTLSLQFPKHSFFFAENQDFTGEWTILPIGLHPVMIQQEKTPYYYITEAFIREHYKPRKKFSHKGTFGHALLISGCYGKMGAAVLASGACLKTGVGLLTTHVPKLGNDILQTSVPEAMISLDQSDILFSNPPDIDSYNAIGIGPALGCRNNSKNGFHHLIKKSGKPLVIDADAINILGENREWIREIPPYSILTPHPKEFARLTGQEFENGFGRHLKQIEFALENRLIVVLKGAYTSIALPDGSCYFNSTGNPGMATAGSGDVLTGVILSLLAQGYDPDIAAILGVYLHGLAGDLAAGEMGEEALTASDLINHLGDAFLTLSKPE